MRTRPSKNIGTDSDVDRETVSNDCIRQYPICLTIELYELSCIPTPLRNDRIIITPSALKTDVDKIHIHGNTRNLFFISKFPFLFNPFFSNRSHIDMIEIMKNMCAIQDDAYWDVKLEDGERWVDSLDPDPDSKTICLEIRTRDGFLIRLRFGYFPPYQCHFNGYVVLPLGLHMEPWLQQNRFDYHEMQYCIHLHHIELTYGNAETRCFGWDHGHFYDANLSIAAALQPHKVVSGPVQVLQEAREFIQHVRDKENEILENKKREQFRVLEKELIEMTCHPTRIAAWVEQEFDPFP